VVESAGRATHSRVEGRRCLGCETWHSCRRRRRISPPLRALLRFSGRQTEQDQQRHEEDPERLREPESQARRRRPKASGPIPEKDQRDQVVQMGEDDEMVARKRKRGVRRVDQHGQTMARHRPLRTDPTAKAQDQIADADFAVAGGNGPQLRKDTADRDSTRESQRQQEETACQQPAKRPATYRISSTLCNTSNAISPAR
jgi:hypothetical protein